MRLLSGLVCLVLLFGPAAASAQESYFTLEGDHFFVHFPESAAKDAQEAARLAEELFDELADAASVAPAEMTHLLILDEGDEANGFATPLPLNRLGVGIRPPRGGSELFPPGESWLRTVIAHELTHIFQMDMKGGQAESIYRAFGKVPVLTSPNMLLPFWFLEGLAVYYETRLTQAGRGRSSIYDMYLRTAALQDEFYTIDEISSQYLMESWPGLQAAYIYGVSLVTYIAGIYGEEALWGLSRAFSETPLLGFGGVLEDCLGVTLGQLWGDWQAWLKEKMLSQGEAIVRQGLVDGEQITRRGFRVGRPAVSSQGQIAFFASGGDGIPGLWLKGDRERLLLKGMGSGVCWSPDGSMLALAKFNRHEGRLVTDLYTYDVRSGKTTRLTWGARADDPAWHGDKLAFISYAPGEGPAIVVMDLATKEQEVVFQGRRDHVFSGLDWSPTGAGLIAGVWTSEGGGILLIDLHGGSWHLLGDKGVCLSPTWSEDGILFSSDRDGVYNLYTLDPATGELWQLTNTLTGAFEAARSPSGQIIYRGYHVGGYDLYRLEPSPGRKAGSMPLRLAGQGKTFGPGEEAAELPAAPYNPWRWMMPPFWWPTVAAAPGGTQVGLSTAASDPLYRQHYALSWRVGFGDVPIGYSLQYVRSFGPEGSPTLGLALNDGYSSAEEDAPREREFRADLEIPLVVEPLLRESLLVGGRCLWEITDTATDRSSLFFGGLASSSLAGGRSWRLEQSVGLYGGKAVMDGDVIFGAGETSWVLDLPRGTDLALRIGGALADREDFFSLGGPEWGDMRDYSLRAYPEDFASGEKVLRASLEWRQLLWEIHRGIWDRVTLVLFAEAGAAWNGQEEPAWKRSLGVEVVVRQVWYNQFPSQWRVGLGRALDNEEDPWRVYLGTGFAF